MHKKKNRNRIKRFLRVVVVTIKRINRKRAKHWFKVNLRQHPFILGLTLFVWLDAILLRRVFTREGLAYALKFHLYLFLAWFGMVVLSNLLRDKQKVKWYLRKRFIFPVLIVMPPMGLILLWSGSHFKRITKVIFTLVFGGYFIIANLQYSKKYDRLIAMPSFDRIVETITKPKKKTFLRAADESASSSLRFTRIAKKPAATKLAVSEIAARCSSAVVSITTKDKDGKDIGMGSGFIVSEDGLIITNFHVVESSYQVEVKIGEEVFKGATLVRGIPNLDMAIIKIEAQNLPVLPIGDSDSLVNGQLVVVLGNPVGLERSVSNGIISAIRSKDNIKMIQMTAPVSPGSSGGPVLNEYGEVIGITTLASFFMTQNLNFAIPINYLDKIFNEKISWQEVRAEGKQK